MNSSLDLPQRVLNLENEVTQLRRRVTWLESLKSPASVEPSVPPRVAEVKPRPPAPLKPPRALQSEPPPIPDEAARSSPRTASVRSPVSSVSRTTTAPPTPSALHELLAALHLLPPSGEKGSEAQIGGWWATRIGALIAVIGVVFFGIYISANTAPWVKWLELALIAGGAIAGGYALEKRKLRIGPVVTGAGHALLYFTAFAAHAVPAVKIVDSVLVAGLMQVLAVVFIGFNGWRRGSATTATMAILLGYVSAFVSVQVGFLGLAGGGGVVLAAAAVGFRNGRKWSGPLYCSVVLTHILNMWLVLAERGQTGIAHAPLLVYGLVLAAFGVHVAGAVLETKSSPGTVRPSQRRVQSANAVLAVLTGLIATKVLLPSVTVAHYLFGAGAVLLGVTAWAVRAVPQDRLVGMFAVKAASLFALGAMAQWDARTRWVALLVEAFVLLAAAQRSQRISLRVTGLAVWIVALLFYSANLSTLRGGFVSSEGLAVLLFLVGSVVLLDWAARQWRDRKTPGTAMAWTLGVVAAFPVLTTAREVAHEAWAPVAGLALAVTFGGFAWYARSRVAVSSAVAAALVAHVAVQGFNEVLWGPVWLWAGAAPLGLISLAVACWLNAAKEFSPTTPADTANFTTPATVAGFVAGLLGIAALAAAMLRTTMGHLAWAATAGLAVITSAMGLRLPRSGVTVAGACGLALGFGLFQVHTELGNVSPGSPGWLAVPVASVPLMWLIGNRSKLADRPENRAAQWIVAGTGVVVILNAVNVYLGPTERALVLTGLGALFSVVAARRRIGPAYAAASALGLLGAWGFIANPTWTSGPDAGFALAAVSLLFVGLGAHPLLALKHSDWVPPQVQRLWNAGHVVVAAVLVTVFALFHRAVWNDYGSVLWALGGIVLFGLGLVGRDRLHRIVGLALLALCIPRVFIHDIEEAQHRIAAFIVLGLLLLWVGFSYQKFRHLIDGSDDEHRNS